VTANWNDVQTRLDELRASAEQIPDPAQRAEMLAKVQALQNEKDKALETVKEHLRSRPPLVFEIPPEIQAHMAEVRDRKAAKKGTS
jgi:3-deoxy-D-arabino-heptulosonate 7-phosphate (DAHP) synthase class II